MNNKVYLAVIGILVVISAVLGYKLSQSSNMVDQQGIVIEEGELERDRLEIKLQKMLIGYDTLKTENATLIAEMAAQRAEIESLLKKVKDKNWKIHTLEKETETLRSIMKGYVFTIDSLNTLNQDLLAQNEGLQEHVTAVEKQNQDLSQQQETMEGIIATGQILSTSRTGASGIRLRSNGKQVDTERASKAEMIKTCFNILENRIAEPGSKTLYMRIIGPDGKVLPPKDGGEQMAFDGEMGSYSVKRQIDYSNKAMDVCIFYTAQSEMAKGDYNVFIYEGAERIGSTILSLK